MKRDLDLIRELLLKIEQEIDFTPKIYSFGFENKKMTVDGYTDEEVYAHLLMLLESPFLDGQRYTSGEISIERLPWQGREFLDTIRDSESWTKTKEAAKKVGGVGVEFMWDVAKTVVKAEVK